MAIVDITIIPIGTENPSVSQYVAKVQHILQQYEEKGVIKYRLTPMSTIIEGELDSLFEVIKHIHESPFDEGALRVATNIRIDDRRDRKSSMDEKLHSVQRRLHK